MDFARKQLEKYGWTAGKGLGKNENGISEALKPKLKRSVTGVGHDLASDFTEHWWNDLYNKAAKNVEVEEVNGKVKKIKSKEATFEITNSIWQIKKKKKDDSPEEQYTDYFVRTAILSNGASKTENINTSESEEEGLAMDIVKMTDEELFAACEGRTAHKGARHGLKALGKLARIEQQEQMLLNQTKYNGYSKKSTQKDKIKIENGISQEKSNKSCDIDQVPLKKKKKKILSDETCAVNITTDSIDQLNEITENKILGRNKKKRDKRKNSNDFSIENNISEEVQNNVPRKKKKANLDAESISCETDVLDLQENNGKDMPDIKKKKKDKRKLDVELPHVSDISLKIEKNVTKKKKSSHAESSTSEANEEKIVNTQENNILIKKKKKNKEKLNNL